jgi:pyruvate-formate lyase-activating enzyme
MSETELGLEYIFDISPNNHVIEHNGYWLVVHPEKVKWLVFTQQEYQVYKFFSEGYSISAALQIFSEEHVVRVATEIIAKDFLSQNEIVTSAELDLFIYLTNRCNLRCVHCYMFSGEIEKEELPLAGWLTVIEDYAAIGGKAITFSGGEPLLYPGFPEIIEYAHSKGLKTCVLSNGLLWTHSLAQQMQGKIDEIQISLDGYDDESYGKVRNIHHGFSDVMRKISMLHDYGFHISLAVTPLYDGISKFCDEYLEFGKKFMKVYPDIHIGFSFELIPGRNISISKSSNQMYTSEIKKFI